VQAVGLRFRNQSLELDLADGRRVTVPLGFFPTLEAATPRQRSRWKYLGPATGFEWEEFDLLLSAEDIAAGRRERVLPPGFRERTIAAMKAAGIRPPANWTA
jgi:hypothetical protein